MVRKALFLRETGKNLKNSGIASQAIRAVESIGARFGAGAKPGLPSQQGPDPDDNHTHEEGWREK